MNRITVADAYALTPRELACCRKAVRSYYRTQAAPARKNGQRRATEPCPDEVLAEVARDWRRRTELLQVVMRMVEEGER